MTNGNSPFWDAGRAGLEDAQVELKLAEAGLQASLEVNDGTIGGQIAKLRQYKSQTDIAGIAVTGYPSGDLPGRQSNLESPRRSAGAFP